MNGSEAKYNHEYVEMKTTLEHIRTKVETIEDTIRDLPKILSDLRDRIETNRAEVASVKATAAVFGGLAGGFFAACSRWFFVGRS